MRIIKFLVNYWRYFNAVIKNKICTFRVKKLEYKNLAMLTQGCHYLIIQIIFLK